MSDGDAARLASQNASPVPAERRADWKLERARLARVAAALAPSRLPAEQVARLRALLQRYVGTFKRRWPIIPDNRRLFSTIADNRR